MSKKLFINRYFFTLLTFGALFLSLPVYSDVNCNCSKDIILGVPSVCVPTPTPTVTPTATTCPPPSISLSTSLVNLNADIAIDSAYIGHYSVQGNSIVNVTSSSGSTLTLTGGTGATLVGNKINYSASGVAARTLNANDSPGDKCTGREPICAKPCNFGGCIDCPCATDKYQGMCRYFWYNVYRYSVSLSNLYTVTATNSCGSASATFDIKVSGSAYDATQQFYTLSSSPISLNLSGNKLDLEALRFTKTNFKLFEASSTPVYWLGSAVTPLLVWDPENTGEIKDGRQLFGTWTFGKEWESGYDALASLDKDKNSVLNLEELKGIRLWADNNKNGISEKDEVKDLKTYGITQIAVKFNREENLPLHGIKFFISDKGFEYTVNEKGVWAESFDWLVPLDSDKVFELEKKQLEDEGFKIMEWSEDPYSSESNRSYGYLVVKKESGDKLSGYHVRALKVEDPGKEAEYSLFSTPLSGVWSDSKFEFVLHRDSSSFDPISETMRAYANIVTGKIVPERLEIIHSPGKGLEMKRETTWKLMEAKSPFRD